MRTTRRTFLRSGALAIAAWPASRTLAARGIKTRPADARPCASRIRFDRILFDARRAQALAFGDAARELGGQVHALSGDIDDPCYDELRRRWRIAPTPVAGLTEFRALFLLQMMASDAGMRTVLRIHHGGHAANLAHEAFGSDAYRAAAIADLSRAGMHWSCAAARLLMCLRVGDSRDPEAGDPGTGRCAAQMSAANLRALDSRALVTWAIA